MPTAPPRSCSYPGCSSLVASGRCEAHRPRKPAYSRLYSTSRWRRESRAYLDRHPLCECAACLGSGIIRAAEVVDHVRPHRGDERAFFDRSNWQAMAKACHDRKTQREVADRERERRRMEG